MPFYSGIDGRTDEGRRTATALLRLKDGLDAAGLPPRTVNDSLMLATWNLRELGTSKYGVRRDEPLYYIFLYDSRKLAFGGLAGEVVLPPAAGTGGEPLAADQLARTPYLAGFRAGWFISDEFLTHPQQRQLRLLNPPCDGGSNPSRRDYPVLGGFSQRRS